MMNIYTLMMGVLLGTPPRETPVSLFPPGFLQPDAPARPALLPVKNPGITAHNGTIEGLVSDRETNTELPGATVRLAPLGRTATTNELGVFRFADLPAGTYTLTVSCLGAEPAEVTITVQNHGTSPIKIALQPAAIELADVAVTHTPTRPLSTLSQLDLRTRPLNSAQDVLRFVPGIVIAQHAGGGKAEQIFLRGFDLDHGTDIALSVDGVPVNMVSHAHGQGYADLHFLIPELIDRVDFQKGTYDTRVGNFATAGYVDFRTADVLRNNFVGLEAGQYDTYRLVSAIDLLGKRAAARGSSAYVAGETLFSNGYFDAPQDFKRNNLYLKFRQAIGDDQVLTAAVSRFSSSWRASGQIPDRAVATGATGFFGAIDPNEGGRTARTDLWIEHRKNLSAATVLRQQVYTVHYTFELYSNFTFFLRDSVNGDEIRQREQRQLTGYRGGVAHYTDLAGRPLQLEGGVQLRYDDVRDNELSRTRLRRQTLGRLALGDVQELNAAAYADAVWSLTPRLTLDAGLRADQFHFTYHDQLDTIQPFRTAARARVSPKLNASYRLSDRLSVYAQSGQGFHSNDTRISAGAPRDANVLPAAVGAEAGVVVKPWPRLLLTASVWRLDLEQEFVYVGDEAVVEPGGRTRRQGLDLSVRWQPAPWLFVDADYTYTRPRTVGVAEAESWIPLAPLHTSAGGLTVDLTNGWRGGLRYRYLADRPANEDYSLTATGFFLLDAQATYAPVLRNGKSPVEFTASVQNLTDARWKEAQFATESRLRGEAVPVEEIHFTPGTPFFLKAGVRFVF